MSIMRVDQRFLGWGVFFILLGAIPLAVSQAADPGRRSSTAGGASGR